MHPSDQHPPTPGRPSLVNSDEEQSINRPRIVGGLDCLDREPAAKWGLAKFPWALCGALLLAIGAASMLWPGDESGKQIIVAGTEPVVAEPPPLQETNSDDVGANDATLPVMVKETLPLVELAPPHVKPVDLGVSSPAVKRHARIHKPKKVVAKKRVKAPPPPRRKPVLPKTESMSGPDKEVALLAAMVMHTKSTAPVSAQFRLKWKQCGTAKSIAAADSCRAHLCTTNEGVAECISRSHALGLKP